MDLQESTLYALDLGAKVTQNDAQNHPHHVTYAPANFVVAMSNGLGEDAFTRKYILTLTPRSGSHEVLPSTHHVTYAQAKFEVATSKSLWGNAFTRKYII